MSTGDTDAESAVDRDTAPSGRLPATTAWAIAIAAAVGVLALATFEPRIAVGAAVGVVFAALLPGFDGSTRRVTVTAALLPTVALGAAAAVGTAAGPAAGSLALLGLVVALTAGRLPAGGITPSAITRAAAAALAAGIVTGAIALGAATVSQVGPYAALETALWLTGDGLRGVLLAVVVAAVTAGAAVVAVPPAAFATPTTRRAYARVQRGLLGWIAVATVGACLALAGLTFLSRYVPVLEPLVATLVSGPFIRGACALVTAVGVGVAAVGAAVRYAWISAAMGARESAAVPILAGSIVGAVGPPGLALVVAAPSATVTAAGGVTAGVLVAGGLVGLAYAQWRTASEGRADTDYGPLAIAAALALGAVVVGATVEPTDAVGAVRTGAVSIAALATGLFVYDVGRYASALARDIGAGRETSPRPQYVRVGWSALVAGVGAVVAAVGLAAATLFAPTLSVPATAAVVVAVGAVVAGTWLLFR